MAINDDQVDAVLVVLVCALYALALPANTASAVHIAIPVSNDFVMIASSFAVQPRNGEAPHRCSLELLDWM